MEPNFKANSRNINKFPYVNANVIELVSSLYMEHMATKNIYNKLYIGESIYILPENLFLPCTRNIYIIYILYGNWHT